MAFPHIQRRVEQRESKSSFRRGGRLPRGRQGSFPAPQSVLVRSECSELLFPQQNSEKKPVAEVAGCTLDPEAPMRMCTA